MKGVEGILTKKQTPFRSLQQEMCLKIMKQNLRSILLRIMLTSILNIVTSNYLFTCVRVTEVLMQTAATEVTNRFAFRALPFTAHSKGSKTTHTSHKHV